MTNEEIIDGVLAWVADVLPDVSTNTYDHVPPDKTKQLPDCIGELQSEGIVREDRRFPIFALQQVALRVYEFELFLMVEAGVDAADAAAAAVDLRARIESLTLSVLADPTLGQRVPMASPEIEADYTRPFAEYPGGVRGREVKLSLAVAEDVVAAD